MEHGQRTLANIQCKDTVTGRIERAEWKHLAACVPDEMSYLWLQAMHPQLAKKIEKIRYSLTTDNMSELVKLELEARCLWKLAVADCLQRMAEL